MRTCDWTNTNNILEAEINAYQDYNGLYELQERRDFVCQFMVEQSDCKFVWKPDSRDLIRDWARGIYENAIDEKSPIGKLIMTCLINSVDTNHMRFCIHDIADDVTEELLEAESEVNGHESE